ncbi:MAG: hypothetical protein RLZZ15_1833 [Verrucomicrobiota bacterium]|jgi:signal transduction histidine kinase
MTSLPSLPLSAAGNYYAPFTPPVPQRTGATRPSPLAPIVAALTAPWRLLRRGSARRAALERQVRAHVAHIAQLEAANAQLRGKLERRDRTELTLLANAAAAAAADDAKRAYLANASHEMIPPANAVLCLAKTLLAAPLNAQGREVALTLHRSGQAILKIADGMAGFSKPALPDTMDVETTWGPRGS